MYSVVPASVLRRLGIKPGRTKTFILADGTETKRSLGEARFRINGQEGTSPVIFGEKGDSTLLGSISLGVLGFMLDPFKRELRPLPMMLASHNPKAASSLPRSWPESRRERFNEHEVTGINLSHRGLLRRFILQSCAAILLP
jgi:predicted aspartyl protease